MKWTNEPPTQDGWYFVRTIWLETGKPDRDISVKHINARRLAEQVKRLEQGVMCGTITVFRREQWGRAY